MTHIERHLLELYSNTGPLCIHTIPYMRSFVDLFDFNLFKQILKNESN